MPLPSELHVDTPLTNMAVDYRNEAFIWDRVFPRVPVAKQSDKFFVYRKKDRFSIPQTLRGPKSPANEIDWGIDTDTYSCDNHALAEFVPDSVVANADNPIRPRQRSAMLISELLELQLEQAAATQLFTVGNYGGSYYTTLSGTTQLDKYATSDPLGVIDTAKDALFREANTLVMGQDVWTKLKRHPQLVGKISGGATRSRDNTATINLQAFSEIAEVENVLVGKAKYNTANKGQDASLSRLWGKYIALLYVDPNVDLETMTYGKTFFWNFYGQRVRMRSGRDESRGSGGEAIVGDWSHVIKITCSDLAYLVVDAVA